MTGVGDQAHPSRDLLADLAADQLPVEQARLVESHVMACGRCAAVITDTERVRAVLRAEVVRMPDHVWHRLSAALAAEAGPGAAPAPPAPPASGWVPADEDAPTQQWQAFVDEDDDEPPARPFRAPQLGLRTGVSRMRSRRDIREERRHATLSRYARPLSIAAGVVAVAGLGLAAVRGLSGGASSAGSEAFSAAAPAGGAAAGSSAAGAGAPEGAATRSSGTNYRQATMGTAAVKLATSASTNQLSRLPGPSLPASAAAAAEPSGSAPASAYRQPPGAAGALGLLQPAQLRACLALLGAPADTTPLLVDLARYEGKDAAIIVLAARDGGYEVWAVARDCHAQYAYTAVPPG